MCINCREIRLGCIHTHGKTSSFTWDRTDTKARQRLEGPRMVVSSVSIAFTLDTTSGTVGHSAHSTPDPEIEGFGRALTWGDDVVG